MNASAFIFRFLQRSNATIVCLGCLRGLLRMVPFFCIYVLAFGALDHRLEMSVLGREGMWLFGLLLSLALFVSGFFPFRIFSLKEQSSNLHHRAPRLRPDDLRLAVELAYQDQSSNHAWDGISAELRKAFLQHVADELGRCRASWCFPSWRWRVPVAAGVFVCALSGSLRAFFPSLFPVEGRTLFPFWSNDIEQHIKIEPGDADVPLGKDANVRLTFLEPSVRNPSLVIKTSDGWRVLTPETEFARGCSYTIKNVVTPIVYHVRWKNDWSHRFTLIPVEPLQIKSFHVRVQPPEYTGKEAVEQTTPEITGLAGSQVDMEAEASKPLAQASILFSDGRERAAATVEKDKAQFRFAIDKEGTYSFALTPKEGAAVRGDAVYPIHVKEDQPPTLTLLSPDQDVVVGEKEKLPLTFDARDDYGLGEAFLIWETRDGKTSRQRIKRFDGSVENTVATYDWDLSAPKFHPGEVVRFHLEVTDKNVITGPGRAVSVWRIVEIRSFEQEHANVEKALEVWRNKVVETLAQVNTLKSKTEAENADMSSLGSSFNPSAENLQKLEEALKQIVNEMENDPLADYGVWLEHKSMEQNMAAMNQGAVKNTQAAFQTQNKAAAVSNMEQIASELERMSTLSENLSKAQKARDVLEAGENLEDVGQNLLKELGEGRPDATALAKIKDLLMEAQKDLMEMARELQQMPQDLPDDFVNQEALKNLEIGKSQDILSQISEAIRRGDVQQALSLAQKFLSMAKEMRKQLGKAHESFVQSNSADELGKKISEQAEALQKVTDQERQVLAETQQLASKRLEEEMRAQADLLGRLALRQEKVIQTTSGIVAGRSNSAMMPVLAVLIKPMEDVGAEFKLKRIEHAPEWLKAIVGQVDIVQGELVRSSATVSLIAKVEEVSREEKSILDAITNPPQARHTPSADEQTRYTDLEKRQQDIRKKTQDVKQRLQLLSRKTASLGPSLMQALSRASSDMQSASEKLGATEGPSAQRFEESALDHLLQGQSELSQAQSTMSDMAMEQGGEGGGRGGGGTPKVILRGGQVGSRGNQTGKVKLPTADDYRPPKAFREDLLESLKENYPKIYEKIIHKYFKRLAE